MIEDSPLKHVAIIMDGNGRWAKGRGHIRVWGHIRGASVVSEIVEEADKLNIDHLTLFTFSTENWARPLGEIKVLFKLLKKFLIKERAQLINNRIKFRVIGDISGLPHVTKRLISDLECETKQMDGLKLTFCFNYGGRKAIIEKVNEVAKSGLTLTEENLDRMFEVGDVDLLIRTGGNQRISNFLLWQMAYAELFFTTTMWPKFTRDEFRKIYKNVSLRERRFGMSHQCSSMRTSKEIGQTHKRTLLNSGEV
jgi:undecaprenyl diphosphate synthase